MKFKSTGYKLLSLLSLLTVCFTSVRAQVAITSAVTANQLVQTIVGTGIQYSNITSNCAATQWGRFVVTGTSNLGLDSGIILTSGTAATGGINIGANCVPAGTQSNVSTSVNSPGDPQLTALAGVTTRDACILEFDFVPTGDSLSFGYVFGSQEYLSFSCSTFNDVFAFFLSGPGIVGAPNLALVPGTNIPVSVNSTTNPAAVNVFSTTQCQNMGPGSPFSQYYVNNAYTPTGPLGNPGGTATINYPGFTTPFLARHIVVPCSTYHIKLAIADGSDTVLDSGVFIAANSFKTSGVSLAYNSSLGQNYPYIQRTCSGGGSAVVKIRRTVANNFPQKIYLSYGGTCVRNVDYLPVPDSVTILPNDTVVSFTVTVVPPPSPVPIQYITINTLNPCSGAITDSIVIPVHNVFPTFTINNDTTILCGKKIDLHIQGINDSAFNYHWSASNTTAIASPTDSFTTGGVITTNTVFTVHADYGVCHDTLHFSANIVQPQITVCADTSFYCGSTAHLISSGNNDSGYNFNWVSSPSCLIDVNSDSVTTAHPYVTTTYTVTATSGACSSSASFTSTIKEAVFSVKNDTTVCNGDSLTLYIAGGDVDPYYTYAWSSSPGCYISNPTDITTITHPTANTNYTVVASVDGHCVQTFHTNVGIQPLPIVTVTPHELMFCITDSIPLLSKVTPAEYSNYAYSWSPATGIGDPTAASPNFFTPTEGDFKSILTVTTPIGCKGIDSTILHAHTPFKIEVCDDKTVKYGESVRLNVKGALYYHWYPTNTLDNPNWAYPVATPTEPTRYTVIAMNDDAGCIDSAHVTVHVDYPDHAVPSVFSPNGDGKNDVFRIVGIRYHRLLEFRIFNRWGQEVFSTTDPEGAWDGRFNGEPADIGSYHYLIKLESPDGKLKVHAGEVTLIR
jgi:gliding motility-associated-like protein